MTTYRLHKFYLPVFAELLPSDWSGEADHRAPALLLRGPTVKEIHAMSEMYQAHATAPPRTLQDTSHHLAALVALLGPMVRRTLGDWSFAGLDAVGVEHLQPLDLNALGAFVMQAGRPDEVADIAPLGGGGQPA